MNLSERIKNESVSSEGRLTITITQEELQEIEEMEKDQRLLNALRGAGVDNWGGWDIAPESLEDE